MTSEDINDYYGKWAYLWDNNVSDGAYEPVDKNTNDHWLVVSSSGQQAPVPVSENANAGKFPSVTSNDVVLIGYTYSGNGSFVSNDTAITVHFGGGVTSGDSNSDHLTESTIYLGSQATFAIDNMFTYYGGTMSFNFGDIATTNAHVTAGVFWTGYDQDAPHSSTFSFSGTLDMAQADASRLSDHTFSYTLFNGTSNGGNLNAPDKASKFPNWTAKDMIVVDEFGNTLTYTDDASLMGTEGYYYLELSPTGTGSQITATLVANGYSGAIPEPATATLSLLALAALAARRRRKA